MSPVERSAGGGGGTPFNGGTITNPLTVDPSADGNPAVTVERTVGDTSDLLDINGNVGQAGAIFAHDGTLQLNADNALTEDQFSIFTQSAQTVNVLNVAQNFAPFATLLRVSAGGRLGIATHSAPADADVNTGEAVLWFDQTNGAAKLMVKAKQADGTVVTGSVPLA